MINLARSWVTVKYKTNISGNDEKKQSDRTLDWRKLPASSFNFTGYVVKLNSFCETENIEFHLSQVTLEFHWIHFLDRVQQNLEDSLPRINQHPFQTLHLVYWFSQTYAVPTDSPCWVNKSFAQQWCVFTAILIIMHLWESKIIKQRRLFSFRRGLFRRKIRIYLGSKCFGNSGKRFT